MATTERLMADVSTHFAFGKNWSDYAKTIDEPRVAAAVENLQRILDRTSLKGMSFCDIGCGSGIHSLSALRLGAKNVLALDIDPRAVETTSSVLARFAPSGQYRVHTGSAFRLDEVEETFDVVYSWGVLHHTGDMWSAMKNASMLVEPGGYFCVALYVKTALCRAWRIEKRVYRKLPRILTVPLILVYSAIDLLRLLIRGHNPITWVREYPNRRGMNYWHDAHDWLGGYPYESASAAEAIAFMKKQGFSLVKSWRTESSLGLTGTGCAEYLFRRDS
jgi:SAM-dependent methyltransferase